MLKQAYTAGVKQAAGVFGLSPRGQELLGLGLIAAPTVHGLVADEDQASKPLKKMLHAADLAGLGLLAHHSFLPHR